MQADAQYRADRRLICRKDLRFSSHSALRHRLFPERGHNNPAPMAAETRDEPAFESIGLHEPARPLLVSVPHAGRHYPDELLNRSRFDKSELRMLEDRYIDAAATGLADRGFPLLIARTARAWIDLNRSEREIDREMFAPMPEHTNLDISLKVRGGLGLVPRRLPGRGDIYDAPLPATDIATTNRAAAPSVSPCHRRDDRAHSTAIRHRDPARLPFDAAAQARHPAPARRHRYR